MSVVPPKFRSKKLLPLSDAGYDQHAAVYPISFSLWRWKSVEVYWKPAALFQSAANFVRFTAQRTLPHCRHEGLHRPPSLCASDQYVLHLVFAFTVYVIFKEFTTSGGESQQWKFFLYKSFGCIYTIPYGERQNNLLFTVHQNYLLISSRGISPLRTALSLSQTAASQMFGQYTISQCLSESLLLFSEVRNFPRNDWL